MIQTRKSRNAELIAEIFNEQHKILKRIYSNKNSDEYKMHGDITKSQQYATMEKLIADLKTLKHFPQSEAKDIRDMFMTLHRPVWKKMVTQYLAKPNERNTTYTIYFTIGYRALRGELARIYASTEATEKGIVYKFDKIARKEWVFRFIHHFAEHLDTMVEEEIRGYEQANKAVKAVQEADSSIVKDTVHVISSIATMVGNVFRHAAELNPVSFISAILSRSYDKKVAKADDVEALYFATKTAYEEYMKLPESKRDKKIESNYVKNIEKYNIKMNNLKAQIAHYDSRAMEEGKDMEEAVKTPASSYSKPEKKEDDDFEDTPSTPSPSEPEEPSSDDNDGFDF